MTRSFVPMEFRPATALPDGDWQFEPKWDGFRCIVARQGSAVRLTSKRGQSLGRYFPEVVEQCEKIAAKRFTLDGEIVIRKRGATFDDLLQRIHPAASRVAALAKSTPAVLQIFDLLSAPEAGDIAREPLSQRRSRLEAFARKYFPNNKTLLLSPATRSRAVANRWLTKPDPAAEGVVAKFADEAYQPGTRDGGFKVKVLRTADCVVGGFRYSSAGGAVGSLLLGLYDADGKLNHVGFTSGFSDEERRKLLPMLKRLIKPPGFTGSKPGGPSRWATARTSEWEPLAPKLVVEVAFDRVTSGRIRHGARFVRWRTDKAPRRCTDDQLTD
ncbi:MAG TPA: ATP-dependent DNA ligase [Candidatus Eremiobacteraceae bacterium]|nr:ATP-dependent DNA ligase [Candidatus Eremiobacteraceae bacterium]